jgi:hypothetical protein
MGQLLLAVLITCLVFVGMAAGDNPGAENKPAMSSSSAIELHPIGLVKRQGDRALIDLRPAGPYGLLPRLGALLVP